MPRSALSDHATSQIARWLEQFEGIPLECDGMTRVLSTLLAEQSIEHTVVIGSLGTAEAPNQIPHFWIEIGGSHIIDLAAQMWFGEKAPHGIFPKNGHQMSYRRNDVVDDLAMHPTLFHILAGKRQSEFTPFPADALVNKRPIPNSKLVGTKAITADGDPVMVFRGEHSECTPSTAVFQSRCTTLSFSDAESASLYAMQPNDRSLYSQEHSNPRVFPCYLSIKKPIVNEPSDPFMEFGHLADQIGKDEALRVFQRFSEHAENSSLFEELSAEHGVTSFADVAQLLPEKLDEMIINTWVLMDDPQFIQCIKAKGFDGAIYAGSGATMNSIEYRVMDMSQIVLALAPELDLVKDTPLQHQRSAAIRKPKYQNQNQNLEP